MRIKVILLTRDYELQRERKGGRIGKKRRRAQSRGKTEGVS